MKKFLRVFCLIALALVMSVTLFACDNKPASAYDIAVANGFVGTEQDWLNSLKGLNGTNGQDADRISVQDLFRLGVNMGIYTDDNAGYLQFVKDCMTDSISEELMSHINNLSTNANMIASVGARCVNSVVSVYASAGGTNFQMGAGVIYSIEEDVAYVVTNYHVIVLQNGNTYTESSDIHMFLYGYEFIIEENGGIVYGEGDILGTYIGGSADYDLAVLKVEGESLSKLKSLGAREVTIASSDDIAIGTTAIALGNPFGSGIALTAGYISKSSEQITVTIAGATRTIRCMRMDTSINSGNSGGGVFDINGHLIGISNAKNTSSQVENVSNAIPSSDIKAFVENILHFYNKALQDDTIVDKTVGLHKYIVGITYSNINPSREIEDDGSNSLHNDMKVVSITSGGTAESMGLMVDDYLLGVSIKRNGQTETNDYYFNLGYELQSFMLSLREGDEISFIIKRGEDTGRTDKHTIVLEGYTIYKGVNVIQNSVSMPS